MEYIHKPVGIHCTTTTQNIIADTPIVAVFLATNAIEAARRALGDRNATFNHSELGSAMLDLHRSLTLLEQKIEEQANDGATAPSRGYIIGKISRDSRR